MIKNRFKSTIRGTKKFLKRLNCSPLANKLRGTRRLKSLSCYTDEGLKKMVDHWNIKHPDDKLDTEDPHKIWNFFKERFSKVCKTERCWLRQKFIENNNRDLLKFFSPDAPKSWREKPYTWLNSRDIEEIMKQYEDAYSNYEFIGASPIDFDKKVDHGECVWDELCKFSLEKKIKKNINKIGIIFNTHPHTKSGEHWIALFVDIKNAFISYFDSNGRRPPKEVTILIDRIKEQGKSLGIKFKYYDNHNMVHQNNDGQCGMYTLYFIIELLQENKKPEYFKTARIPDETMRDYRFIYYN